MCNNRVYHESPDGLISAHPLKPRHTFGCHLLILRLDTIAPVTQSTRPSSDWLSSVPTAVAVRSCGLSALRALGGSRHATRAQRASERPSPHRASAATRHCIKRRAGHKTTHTQSAVMRLALSITHTCCHGQQRQGSRATDELFGRRSLLRAQPPRSPRTAGNA